MGLREVKSLPKVTQLGKGQSQHWIQSFWLQGCCAMGQGRRWLSWTEAGQSGFQGEATSLFLSGENPGACWGPCWDCSGLFPEYLSRC